LVEGKKSETWNIWTFSAYDFPFRQNQPSDSWFSEYLLPQIVQSASGKDAGSTFPGLHMRERPVTTPGTLLNLG
jgi:hypothetical protein